MWGRSEARVAQMQRAHWIFRLCPAQLEHNSGNAIPSSSECYHSLTLDATPCAAPQAANWLVYFGQPYLNARVRAYSHSQNAGIVLVMRNSGFVEDARVNSIENIPNARFWPVKCRHLPSIMQVPAFSREPPRSGSCLSFFECHEL